MTFVNRRRHPRGRNIFGVAAADRRVVSIHDDAFVRENLAACSINGSICPLIFMRHAAVDLAMHVGAKIIGIVQMLGDLGRDDQ